LVLVKATGKLPPAPSVFEVQPICLFRNKPQYVVIARNAMAGWSHGAKYLFPSRESPRRKSQLLTRPKAYVRHCAHATYCTRSLQSVLYRRADYCQAFLDLPEIDSSPTRSACSRVAVSSQILCTSGIQTTCSARTGRRATRFNIQYKEHTRYECTSQL